MLDFKDIVSTEKMWYSCLFSKTCKRKESAVQPNGVYRKRIVLGLMLFVITAGVPQPSDARSLEEIRKSGEIRICIAPIYPSYAVAADPGCVEDCEFTGPVIREVNAFLKILGDDIRPKFMRIDWDEQFHNKAGVTVRTAEYTPEPLECGRCDFYPNHLTVNAWRLKKLDFAVLFSSRMMAIVNRASLSRFKTRRDLAGKHAVVEKDTSFHTWLQGQNKSAFADNPIVIELLKTHKAMEAVENGEADFTLIDTDISLWAVNHHLKQSTVAFPVGDTDQIGWAFRKADQDLKNAVDDFFRSQRKNPISELNTVWSEEFGVNLQQLKTLVHATE